MTNPHRKTLAQSPTPVSIESLPLPTLAQACAQRDFRVFPVHCVNTDGCSCASPTCSAPGGHPRTPNWRAAATNDPAVIAKWWTRWPDANVGVLTDMPGKFVVVDPTKPLPNDNLPVANGDIRKGQLPTGKVFQAAHRAIFSRGDWNFQDDEMPYFQDRSTGLTFTYGRRTDGIMSKEAVDAARTSLQRNISVLDPPTSIVLTIVIAKWLVARQNNTLPYSRAVTIHVNEILDIMGKSKHHNGGYRAAQKADISQRFMQLRAIEVDGPHPDPSAKGRFLHGSLLDITFDVEQDTKGRRTPFAFIVRPGGAVWDDIAGTDPQLADFFVSLTRLDTSQGKDRLAFFIGHYLVIQLWAGATHNFNEPIRLETLLIDACIAIEVIPQHYERFRDYVVEALNQLRKDGVISSWHYYPGDETKIPDRNWFRHWLQNRVVIIPPIIEKRLEPPSRIMQAIANLPPPLTTGTQTALIELPSAATLTPIAARKPRRPPAAATKRPKKIA